MKKFKKAILPIALSISVIGLAGCSTGGTKYISSKAGDVTEKDIVESIGASQLSKTATSMMIQKVLLDKYKNKIKVTRPYCQIILQDILHYIVDFFKL